MENLEINDVFKDLILFRKEEFVHQLNGSANKLSDVIKLISFIFIFKELFFKSVFAHDQEGNVLRSDWHWDPSIVQIFFCELILVSSSAAISISLRHLNIRVGWTGAPVEVHFVEGLEHEGILPSAVIAGEQQFLEEVIESVVDWMECRTYQTQSLLNSEDGFVVKVKDFGNFKIDFGSIWKFGEFALKDIKAPVLLDWLVCGLAFLGHVVPVDHVIVIFNSRSFNLWSLFRLDLPILLLLLGGALTFHGLEEVLEKLRMIAKEFLDVHHSFIFLLWFRERLVICDFF